MGLGWVFIINIGYIPNLKKLELSGNNLEGYFPSEMSNANSLEVVDVSFNSMTGDFPVLKGLVNLRYLDIRENNFTGIFSLDYFSPNSFTLLRYIGLNHNDNLEIPDVCIRVPFCFKSNLQFNIGSVLLKQVSGDLATFLTQENMDYIDNSEYYYEREIYNIP